MERPSLLTFDVYTALFDVEGSLTPVVQQALPAQEDYLELVRVWRRKQLEYVLISNSLQQGRTSFAVITRRALDYTLSRMQVELTERACQDLVAAWNQLLLWPEAAQVVREMKARGYRIGLLSNGDDSMLRALAARLPVPCDDVFSSEQAGCYKPHPSVYALPWRALRLAADQILHVAGSPTDVMGAKAAGLRCAWSNRQHDRVLDARYSADHEFGDLRGLLGIVP